jgi:DNA-binding GntR family transcriptional regulator
VPLDIVIDRSSPVPLYYQLAQSIESALQRGDLEPGDRMEAEIDLAVRTGLSRPTVRQAIQELVQRGILVRRRGIGTHVVQQQMRRPLELSSLYDDLTRAKHQPTTTVLGFSVDPATEEVASHLDLAEGDDVYVIERLRYDGESPLALIRNWLPADLLDLDRSSLTSHGLYELIRRSGVRLHVANQSIGAKEAAAQEAKLLGVKTGAALLTMERTTFNDTGRAIEWARSSYRADLYSFDATLVGH